jgi:hypothetical protein
MKSEEPPCEKVDSKMGSCQENQPFGGRDEDVFEVGEVKKEAGSIRTSLFFSPYV